jgi:hypothetical protein
MTQEYGPFEFNQGSFFNPNQSDGFNDLSESKLNQANRTDLDQLPSAPFLSQQDGQSSSHLQLNDSFYLGLSK